MANGNGLKKIYIEDVLPLIDQYKGNVSDIARHLKVHRHTVQARIDESSHAQQALENARESLKDRAVKMLHERMDKSDTLLIFYLKTQAKDRGYIERQEFTGADGEAISIKVIGGVNLEDI